METTRGTSGCRVTGSKPEAEGGKEPARSKLGHKYHGAIVLILGSEPRPEGGVVR